MLYWSPLLSPLLNAAAAPVQNPVLITKKSSHTAAVLLTSSKVLASQLIAKGMRQGDIVAIVVAPGYDFITIMYATIMIRARAAIIDPEMGRELYRVKLEQLSPTWAFVDTRLLFLQEHPLLRAAYFKLAHKPVYFPRKKGLKIVGCGLRLPLLQSYIPIKKLRKSIDPLPLEETEPDHDYLITYTSGTVQEPKGVVHNATALAESIAILSKLVKRHAGDTLATAQPHFVLMGIAAQLPVFLYEANLSIPARLEFFEQNKITSLFGPPSDFLPLIRHCQLTNTKLPRSLSHILLGSAPVHQAFLKQLQSVAHETLQVTIIYGMTEHLVISTIDGNDKLTYTGKGDIVGKPVAGVEIKTASDGELLIKSNQLYSGYFHLNNRDEYHASGDLAEIDEHGNILLMGRKKEMIIRRNFNIYPALYEGTIKKIPGVEEAAFVGIYSDIEADETVYLAIEANTSLTENEIFEKISYGEFQIDKEALPDKIVIMDIPRKGRQNKMDRMAIVNAIRKKL